MRTQFKLKVTTLFPSKMFCKSRAHFNLSKLFFARMWWTNHQNGIHLLRITTFVKNNLAQVEVPNSCNRVTAWNSYHNSHEICTRLECILTKRNHTMVVQKKKKMLLNFPIANWRHSYVHSSWLTNTVSRLLLSLFFTHTRGFSIKTLISSHLCDIPCIHNDITIIS